MILHSLSVILGIVLCYSIMTSIEDLDYHCPLYARVLINRPVVYYETHFRCDLVETFNLSASVVYSLIMVLFYLIVSLSLKRGFMTENIMYKTKLDGLKPVLSIISSFILLCHFYLAFHLIYGTSWFCDSVQSSKWLAETIDKDVTQKLNIVNCFSLNSTKFALLRQPTGDIFKSNLSVFQPLLVSIISSWILILIWTLILIMNVGSVKTFNFCKISMEKKIRFSLKQELIKSGCTTPFDFVDSIFASILHYATRILNIDIRYSGNTDILLQEGPCVLILNHQSCLDILPLCKIIPTNIICMAKQSLIYAGAFGFCCALSGSILINRKLKQRTDFANICAKQILDKNLKLIIFPEGTRNSSGEILPFKCGAFNIAVSGKIPIIPVVISPYHFIDHDNKTFKYGIVNVNILPQINTYDMTLEDVPSLCNIYI
ncbi:hypothetical protein A3Q56_03416 [Intoshia linei]|uniref:1-acyl-sn-glycerol-3-phosphate acyltransferase n=1 Tax=Intoshia linei TaxID=1819745 RepID=A0A177B608_9BILA|nr:hypothetical protein A3Q56_03416 [Intoshia linei]